MCIFVTLLFQVRDSEKSRWSGLIKQRNMDVIASDKDKQEISDGPQT